MKSSFVYVVCAATVLLVRPAGADLEYELDHPVIVEITENAITAPASTSVERATIDQMSWWLVEPTSCISPCLSPVYDLMSPTVNDQGHTSNRLDLTSIPTYISPLPPLK